RALGGVGGGGGPGGGRPGPPRPPGPRPEVSHRDRSPAEAALPPGLVPPAIRAALGGEGPDLTAHALTHNAGNNATGGIGRVEGPAGRAVLKLVTAAGGGDRAW